MPSDNFNRADGNLSSPWTVWSGMTIPAITSNAIGNTSGSDGDIGAYYSTSTAVYSEVKISATGGKDGGPALAVVGATSGYFVTAYSGTDILLFRIDSGTFTELAKILSATYATNDVISIERSGANLIVKQNTTTIITHSDSTYTSVVPGVYLFDQTLRLDDWTDGVVGGGGSSIAAISNYYRMMRAA